MAFDVEKARQEGYSEAEIANYLATTRKFDIKNARKEGYSDAEIIQHLTGGKVEVGQATAEYNQPLPRTTPDYSQEKSPVDEMSGMDKFLAGMGGGLVGLYRGAKQRVLEGADAVGIPGAKGELDRTQRTIDVEKKLAAPLYKTLPAKVGGFAGVAAPAVAASFIPGVNTLVGSGVSGGLFGLATPTTSDQGAKDVILNTALGAGGGMLGFKAGEYAGKATNKVVQAAAKAKKANALKDTAASNARTAGYKIPPSTTNPTKLNQTLEGISGKILTGQRASKANEATTRRLVGQALGIDDVTPDAVDGVRNGAGAAYEALKNQPAYRVDPQFLSDLDNVGLAAREASQEFPNLMDDAVENLRGDFMGKSEFQAGPLVEAVKTLRANARANLRPGANPTPPGQLALGKAQRQLADVLEGLIERNLTANNQPGLLNQFKDARQLIAQSHLVDDALNPATGAINPKVFAKALEKGQPVSGDLRVVAETASAFPKAMQDLSGQSVNAISPLDYTAMGGLFGIGAMSGNPLLAALGAVRPAVREVILSAPYQAAFGAPGYGTAIPQIAGKAGQYLLPGLAPAAAVTLPNTAK